MLKKIIEGFDTSERVDEANYHPQMKRYQSKMKKIEDEAAYLNDMIKYQPRIGKSINALVMKLHTEFEKFRKAERANGAEFK